MGPAEAMGVFLRTWRQQWAGLSRSQLALAVGRICPEREFTTESIRRWEEGQAPKTTAELEALIQVMGRHGLQAYETEQFRQAACTAVLDRHYPELFTQSDWAASPDVAEVAEALSMQAHLAPASLSVVDLVARTSEIQAAVTSPDSSGPALRQEAALVCLLAGLGSVHGWSGRSQLAAQSYSQAADLSFGCLGEEGRGNHGWVMMQVMEAAAQADSGGGVSCARRMLELCKQAWSGGDHDIAVRAFFGGLDYLESRYSVDTAPLSSQVTRYLSRAEQLGIEETWRDANAHLFWVKVARGEFDAAEGLIDAFEPWQNGGVLHQLTWYWALGNLCLRRGDVAEARRYIERSIDLAVENEMGTSRQLQALQECSAPTRRPRNGTPTKAPRLKRARRAASQAAPSASRS